MEIKHILEYDYNYAEYVVTDGKHDTMYEFAIGVHYLMDCLYNIK